MEHLDSILRYGLVALIAVWSAMIIAPFIGVLLWAIIVAVSAYPVFRWLTRVTGNRDGLAATCVTLMLLVVIVGPIFGSLPGLIDGVRALVANFQEGRFAIPPAAEQVRDWPVIGPSIHLMWSEAHTNIASVLERFQPQLREAGVVVLGSVTGLGLALLQFVASIIIAGILLGHHRNAIELVERLANRLVPDAQDRYLQLTEHTVRGVTTGVVGVAFIQALLAGIGFTVIGVPAAPLWAALCLVLGVVQLTIAIVVVPICIYVFMTSELLPFVLFVAWNIPILALDNVLKPILMGRGVDAPMLVIFLGAIGGFIAFGFLGLFFGAVVLVIAYDLLQTWLDEASRGTAAPEDAGSTGTAPQ
jgi:predicted PurR-regulated permease PerM